MYKLIIGNVRIMVQKDEYPREKAILAAQEAIQKAGHAGKVLSQIEICDGETGIEVKTVEKTGGKANRKSLKQSMCDGIKTAVREKLYPSQTFGSQENWFDPDTGQQWHGAEVTTTRDHLMNKLEEWLKTL